MDVDVQNQRLRYLEKLEKLTGRKRATELLLWKSRPMYAEIVADMALFTNPLTKPSGDAYSYSVPTYESLKGILKNVYSKPTFEIVVAEARVMRPISRLSVMYAGDSRRVYISSKRRGKTSPDDGKTIRMITYLREQVYRVEFFLRWNTNQVNLLDDCVPGKHADIMLRSLERGGASRGVHAGTRDCPAFAHPLRTDLKWRYFPFTSRKDFEAGEGAYDDVPLVESGWAYHSLRYPNELPPNPESGKPEKNVYKCWWECEMHRGKVRYPDPILSVQASHDPDENRGKIVHEYMREATEEELRLFPNRNGERIVV